MRLKRYLLLGSFLIISFLLLTKLVAQNSSESANQDVYIGTLVTDYDKLLSLFLRSLDHLDYDKKHLTLQFDLSSQNLESKAILSAWIAKNGNLYKAAKVSEHTDFSYDLSIPETVKKAQAQVKNSYLEHSRSENCSHCLILSSSAFISPNTLKELIQRNKPIVAPLLRPAPETDDPYRNFFGDVDENGFYKFHPDYAPIANRDKKGTFKTPCIHTVYLIDTKVANKLSFTDEWTAWDFITFSNNARKNQIDQYICNEREFGFLLHFKNDLDQKNRQDFTLVKSEIEITPSLLKSLFHKYENDLTLKEHIDHFDYAQYALYRVQNQYLFYVDEVFDYIKHYVIKQGRTWEDHIHAQFKKYAKPGTVVLDIGGHIGTHTLNLSQIVGENGEVHVFEPQVKMFTELAINMHLNDCKNVICHHNALGSEEKWVEVYIPKESWTENFGPNLINEGHGTVSEVLTSGNQTKMIRLDDLQLNNISFIKMDIEGYEMEVVKGGRETILRNRPVMIIEIFAGPDNHRRIKEIESLGYDSSSLGGDDYLFIPKEQKSPIQVAWEGTFLDLGSLSHVNRAFVKKLADHPHIHVTPVNNAKLEPDLESLSEIQSIAKLLQPKAPDNVQVTVRHAWPPNWQPPLGKWVLIQPWEFGALPREWVEQSNNIDEIWVPTNFVKQEYVDSGVPAEKIYVIPNGIDTKRFHPQAKPYPLPTNKKYKFLFVGGTIYRKGADILINSYLNAFTDKDDVCLVIKDFGSKSWYANQTHQNQIKAAQQKPGAPEIVYLDLEMSEEDIAGLYTASDCLVYPYRGEGFALPVLEAMASGLPVIVTEGGATDDFVKDLFGWFIPAKKQSIGTTLGTTELIKEGWLLEPNASILSTQLYWIAAHPEEGRKKGLAASEHVHKEWSWEKTAGRVAERLKKLAD